MEIFGVYLVNQSSGITTSLYQDKVNTLGRGIPGPQGEKGKVLLPHPSISKIHAEIVLKPETHEWFLKDKSRHGIFVNNKKIKKEIRLMHGDKIKIGPFSLMFYEKFKADDETSEQPLPVHFETKKSNSLVFLLGALLIQIVLAWWKPEALLMLSASLLFFSGLLIAKPTWREKSKLSLRVLFILLLLATVGSGLSVYMFMK